RGLCQHDSAPDIDQRAFGLGERAYDRGRGIIIEVRLRQRLGISAHAVETFDVYLTGEYVHRHVHEYRSGLAALRQLKCFFDDFRKQFWALDSPRSLHEWAIDFELGRVAMEIDFLVRVFAIEVTWNIACDHNHGNAVQRGVGHTGRSVGQTGTKESKKHRRLAGDASITISGMRRDLFVPDINKTDLAVRHRRKR